MFDPTVCSIKNTNWPSVIDGGFVTLKLLPVACVNVTLFILSKAYCEFSGDTNIAQLILDPEVAIEVLAPLKIDWGAAPDNCNVVL